MKRKAILTTLGVVCTFAFVGCVAVGCKDNSSGTEEPEKFTVTYERGATDATGDIPEIASYAAGESFTLLPSDTFVRVDYDFKCWSYGGNDYAAGAQFTMPENNVTFTAVWEDAGGDEPDPPDRPDPPDPPDEKDEPTLAELDEKFYDASEWAYMTNDGGASADGGDKVYALGDGSVKFHRANQSVLFGDQSNRTMSFMLKGTNDWSIWFNSSSKDNADNYSYRLAHAYGGLRLVVSSAPEQAAAVIDGTEYNKGEWNRFDVVFETVGKETSIKVYINGKRAALSAGDNASPAISVADNVLKHTRPAMFETGNYVCVKVWEAHNYVQIKPVAKADEADVPIIACVGASITEGAGAGNFYTESYPAQLQNALGGAYNVVNLGNSGKTVNEDMTENGNPVGWLKQNQWIGFQSLVPDRVIINMGTNDSKTSNDPVISHDAFKADYLNLLDKMRKINPELEIYICTVPYAYTGIWNISNENIANIVAPVQREIAEENEYTLIDLYKYTQNKALLFGDGVHPNTTGYALFIEAIERAFGMGAHKDDSEEQFEQYLNEKYNDKMSDYAATIAKDESDGKIYLTVSGATSLTEGIEVYIGDGDVEHYYTAEIVGGRFECKTDLAALKGNGKWYNLRVYAPDGISYHIITLDDTELIAGDEISGVDAKATVKSWNTNWGASLSFVVTEPYSLTVTEAAIDGNNLVVSGTTNAEAVDADAEQGIAACAALRLYIGDGKTGENSYNRYVDVTVTGGAFTATFDLSAMPVGGWYNARLYFPDSSYYPLSYTQINYNGGTLAKGDMLYFETTKAKIESWDDGSTPTLSFSVEQNDGSGDIKLSTVTIEKSGEAVNLRIVGRALGISSDVYEKALLYIGKGELTGENYQTLCKPMTETIAGEFEVTYDLTGLDVGDGYQIRIYRLLKDGTVKGWYTIKFSEVNIENGDVFATDTKVLTFATQTSWAPVEISVREVGAVELIATLTSQTVTMENGKINLNIAGTTNDVGLKLAVDDGKGHSGEQAVTRDGDGNFTVSLDLSALEAVGDWYFAKLVYSDGTSRDIKRADVLFGGYALVPWVNGVSANDNKLYANNKVIKPQNTDKFAITVSNETGKKATVTSVVMTDNKYIAHIATMNAELTGAGLYKFTDSTVGEGYAGTVTGGNGYYTVEVDLSAFAASGDWYFLALDMDDAGLTKADFPAHQANPVKYAYNDLVFTTKYNWATAIQVSTLTKVMISSVSFDNNQLVICGNAASSVTKLQLYLNNTNIKGDNIVNGKLYENTAVELASDKSFVLRIDLSYFKDYDIKSNALNLRMLINEDTTVVTANTDINLKDTCEYEGKTYSFKTQNSTIALTAQ